MTGLFRTLSIGATLLAFAAMCEASTVVNAAETSSQATPPKHQVRKATDMAGAAMTGVMITPSRAATTDITRTGRSIIGRTPTRCRRRSSLAWPSHRRGDCAAARSV
jgi:hypothetical protein